MTRRIRSRWWFVAVVATLAVVGVSCTGTPGPPTVVVSTLSGFSAGAGNADGPVAAATFWAPTGLAFDSLGGLFVANTGGDTIRKITPDGTVSTIAGVPEVGGVANVGSADGPGAGASFNDPTYLATDGAGNVYVSDVGNRTIRKVDTDDNVSTVAGVVGVTGYADGPASSALFGSPGGLAVDKTGNVFVADSSNHCIREITPLGVVSTIAGTPIEAGTTNGPEAIATFDDPTGLAFDASGNLYVADGDLLRKISTKGVVTTAATLADLAGQGGRGVAISKSGDIYVAGDDVIDKMASGGTITTFAGAVDSDGNVGGGSAFARFVDPEGLAVDRTGSVYVGDSGNNEIRQISYEFAY